MTRPVAQTAVGGRDFLGARPRDSHRAPPVSAATTLTGLVLRVSWGLHLCATLACTLGMVGVWAPFFTALALLITMFFRDHSIFFIYPAMMLMSLAFLSPLILAGAPIAVKAPPNGTQYDRELILCFYWFVGILALYLPSANKLRFIEPWQTNIGKTDAVTCVAVVILITFAALMLRNGTLFDAGYRDVTAERFSFIEYASVTTLIGFCTARSKLARHLLIAAALVYLASAFLVGLRLRFISVGTVLFLCVVGREIRAPWKLASILVALILFTLGVVRMDGLASANLGAALSIENMYIQGALVSTPGGAFQTSKFHAYYVNYIADLEETSGVMFFLGDLAAIVLTKSGIPELLNLKTLTSTAFDVPGGGMIFGFFYAYSGLVGSIVLSLVFVSVMIVILRTNSTQAFPYQVILAAYAPRTLLYDWTIGFKMMVVFLVVQHILSALLHLSQDGAVRPLPARRG